MLDYCRYLKIADIRIQILSEVEFYLEKDCRIFEVDDFENYIDVKFNIYKYINEEFEEYSLLNNSSSNYVEYYIKDNKILKVAYYDNDHQDIAWYLTYENSNCPKCYNLYFKDVWKNNLKYFNPLFIPGLTNFLTSFQTLMLHSSLISIDNMGIAFTAPSGTGKSTQANLWGKYYNAEIINGDRALIRKSNDRFMAYGSPYAGSSFIYKNESVNLDLIVVLRQAKYNKISMLNYKQKYLFLISEIGLSQGNKINIENQMELISDLINNVQIILLECLPNKDAVTLVYEYLKKEIDYEKY